MLLRHSLLVTLVVAALGCNSERVVSPRPSNTASELADRMAALSTAARARGDVERGLSLIQLASTLKMGATPTTISVTERGATTETFQAVVSENLDSSSTTPAQSFGERTLIAWRGDSAQQLLRVELLDGFASLAGPTDVAVAPPVLANYEDASGAKWMSVSGTTQLTPSGSSAPCPFMPSLFPGMYCTLTSYHIDLNIGLAPYTSTSNLYPPSATADIAWTLSIANQSAQGVRMIMLCDASPVGCGFGSR